MIGWLFEKFACSGISPRVEEMTQSFDSGDLTESLTAAISQLEGEKRFKIKSLSTPTRK